MLMKKYMYIGRVANGRAGGFARIAADETPGAGGGAAPADGRPVATESLANGQGSRTGDADPA